MSLSLVDCIYVFRPTPLLARMMPSSDSPSPLSETDAATRIQNAWRCRFRFQTTRKVLDRFLKAGLSLERMKSTS